MFLLQQERQLSLAVSPREAFILRHLNLNLYNVMRITPDSSFLPLPPSLLVCRLFC